METASLTALSPLDGRYASKTAPLREYLSEYALIRYRTLVEVRWLQFLADESGIEDLPPLEVDADLIRDTRERMRVSRAVFARRLRISTRTLENWEQGRARPNAQAAALILMVRKFPDTLEKLSELGNQAA